MTMASNLFVNALALYLLTALPACGVFSGGEPDWSQVHSTAEAMRRDVNVSADDINAAVALLDLVCKLQGSTSGPCSQLLQMHDGAKAAAEAARRAIDLYDVSGEGAATVDLAIAKVHATAARFAAASEQLAEVIHDSADRSPAAIGPSGGEPPAPEAPDVGSGAAPMAGPGSGAATQAGGGGP